MSRSLSSCIRRLPVMLMVVLIAAGLGWAEPGTEGGPDSPAGVGKIAFEGELDFADMTRAQYGGAVSMAMEGMRLVYGEMSAVEEKKFESDWMPLFAHPSKEIVAYLNQLNPLLARFIAIRGTMNQTLESYQSILFEMTVAASMDDVPYLRELVFNEQVTVAMMNRLNDQLNAVIEQIVELRDPPHAAELQRRRKNQYEETVAMIRNLGGQAMLRVVPSGLTTVPMRKVEFQALVHEAPEGARLRWLFHDGRSLTTDLNQKVTHEFLIKAGLSEQDQPLKVHLINPKNITLAKVTVPIKVKHHEGQWVMVDRQIERVCSTDFVNSARDAGFTGAEGSLNKDKLIYAFQEMQPDSCQGTLTFKNPPGDEGWRVHFWWTDPPKRLNPADEVVFQVKAEVDFIGGIRYFDKEKKRPLPNGEITARLTRIRPWDEQNDLQWNAEGRAKSVVGLETVTDEQSMTAHPMRQQPASRVKVPRPYLAETFGARKRIDPTGQILMINVENTMEYRGGIAGRRTNRFNVRYLYRWDPTGKTFQVWGEDEAADALAGKEQEQTELSEFEQEERSRRAQIEFHRKNIEYFEDNMRSLNERLRAETDPDRRNELTRDLLYQEDAAQREEDAIAMIQTGQFVRTRTNLDAFNMKMMLEEGQKMAEDAHVINRTLERMPGLIAMADPADRELLTKFFDKRFRSGPGGTIDVELVKKLTHMIGNQVVGGLERQSADADLAAIDAAERLERTQNIKTFCDGYLVVLSTAAPLYHAYTAPHYVAGMMRAQKMARAYTLYQGTTGYIEGGPTKAFTNVAASYNTVTKLANAGMEGYHDGVLKHLENYAQNPGNVTLDETSAGLSGAMWQMGTEALKAYIMNKGMAALMPPQPSGPVKKWPTIEQQIQQARFQSRQANGRVAVKLFQQRAARLATAGQRNAPQQEIQSLRQSMNEAYTVVKSDYFAKMHLNKLAREGDLKTTHYYQSCERSFMKRLTSEVDRRMAEAGFSPQKYKSFSNSSSKGKVGMDLDFGVVEPPRYIIKNGQRIPNPEHVKWRRGITQTMPDGAVVQRSPHEMQVVGNEMLHAAYEDVYGRPPGEAMIEFTSSYHPEAYRDLAWLGKKGSKTALIFDTDPQWVQQAADVTNFKIHHLPKDHPHLTYYGHMQERMRGLTKDFDTKIEPMIQHQAGRIDPKAMAQAREMRNVMNLFARDEIGPIEAETRLREISGGRGMVEVADQLTILMGELRVNLPSRPGTTP